MLEDLISRTMQAGKATSLGPLLQSIIFALSESVDAEAILDRVQVEDNPAASLISKIFMEVKLQLFALVLHLQINPRKVWVTISTSS